MDELISMTANRHKFSLGNKVARTLWIFVSFFLFKPFAPRIFRKWRIIILKLFGAKIKFTCTIHSNVKIWAPWNLKMDDYSCLGPNVDCYNQGLIIIGANSTISQKVYLCASSHDYNLSSHPLILAPIIIGDKVWVAADAFIGPGVKIGEGAVVGARAAVFKEIDPWVVVGGNPSKFIKKRVIKNA